MPRLSSSMGVAPSSQLKKRANSQPNRTSCPPTCVSSSETVASIALPTSKPNMLLASALVHVCDV
eukprot:817-Prymnesium_polylepis.1